MFKTIIRINFILFFISSLSIAQTISEIKVDGNKRISKESIIIFGDIDFNKSYNDDDLDMVLKNIYETNFFEDVSLDINSGILNINVKEFPVIQNIEFNGIKRQKTI